MTWRPPQGVLGELIASSREDCAVRRKAARGTKGPSEGVARRTKGRFVGALRGGVGFPLICEVKRASPSVGTLDAAADAPAVARRYVEAGARCVSVLTESRRFGGSLDDLRAVRATVAAPLLRKDFIVDPFMVTEAAEAGADCILLIAAALEPALLRDLAVAADEAGLDTLLELIYERDLEALALRDWPLVGVNARDLETLEMDAGRFARFAPRIAAPGRLLVAESGIKSPADVARYRGEGAQVGLVGESLMRAKDPAALVRSLVGAT